MNYDISVIIASYNPSWEKLKKTVNSILFQKDVKIEVIVADDCSENNYFNELNDFLKGKCDYKLLSSNQNVGTTKNVYRALQEASSKYVKLISPGDYIYNENILKIWLDFVKEHNSKISFGKAVYYNDSMGEIKLIRRRNSPQEPISFNFEKGDKLVYNYLICGNAIHAVTLLSETRHMLEYLSKIKDVIKYCEDKMFDLMISDYVRFDFFDQNVVFYEYGSGISTSGNQEWYKKIADDVMELRKMVALKLKKNWFGIRFNLLFKMHYEKNINTKYIKYLLFPRSFFWRLRYKIKPLMTSTDVDLEFYNRI